MEKKRHGKSVAREQAMIGLYGFYLKNDEFNQENLYSKDKLANSMVVGVLSHQDEIDKLIVPHLKKWSITELNKVNLAILELAIYEIIYDTTPSKIVVSEALDMAKRFSDIKSKNFIHNVLDKVTRTL